VILTATMTIMTSAYAERALIAAARNAAALPVAR